MKLADLIQIRPIPAVVQAADVRALRQNPESPAARDFIGGYLGFDARARHALETLLHNFAESETGGAFWLNGVFGCGKSHLLGLLALLCDGAGREVFAATHPHLAELPKTFAPRLVVHFSLDDYDAARWSLEEVFWREVEREWEKRGLETLELEKTGARGEIFADFHEKLAQNGLCGLCVFADELSLFLGAREHKALQGDASFLQFLGQHSRRAPFWICAALQKTVEDIGGIETYSLSQIRDRYTLLPLSLAHLPSLIERRLIEVKNPAELERIAEKSFQNLAESLPRLDFGPREWKALFPFHPATIQLLEAAVGRFFSRTRSAALFCVQSVYLEESAQFRVPVEAIWDYFASELEIHPDLRPLAQVFESWHDAAPDLAPSPGDVEPLRRVMKALLLFKIAGISPTPVQIANALNLEIGLGGDGNYEYARVLLERLRLRASFLAVERAEEPIFDRYAVDLGRKVGELARRHLQNSLATLEEDDPRVAAHALNCCRDEPWPLAELGTPRSFPLFWRNGVFRVAVQVWDGQTAPELVANRAAATRELGAPDDAFLLVLPPFGTREWSWNSAANLLDAASKGALWVWKPRAALNDEWELAREAAAAQILEGDPQLTDNRRGRAVLEWLQNEAPGRRAALSRICGRLLREGEIILGSGAVLEASELAAGENWVATLENLADFGFPALFGRWPEIAPRARLLTPSNSDALCLEILRRPAEEPFFAPSLERLARHIGEPLGVAKSAAGRWKIAPGNAELSNALKTSIADGKAFSLLEAELEKGEWGLRRESTAIVLCALLRGGEIAAFDARGAVLAPGQIGLPLRRSVQNLRPGALLEGADWTKLAQNARLLFQISVGARSFEEQSRVATLLAAWRDEKTAESELARARLAQLRRQVGQNPASWAALETDFAQFSEVLELLAPAAPAELLARVSNLDGEVLRPTLARWQGAAASLEERLAPLLALHARLNHAELVAPPDLAPARAEILAQFDGGPPILQSSELLEAARLWSENYAQSYAGWHQSQHDAARGLGWRRLAQSDELRALERLTFVKNRPLSGNFREEIEGEIAKLCPRDGRLGPGEAVCGSCGLRFGERVGLTDIRALESQIAAQFAAFKSVLDEAGVQEALERQNCSLLEWDGTPDALLPLLSGENLRLLDDALRPRRRVLRSKTALLAALEKAQTRSEIARAFENWLEAGQNLAGDDEIEWAE